MVEKVVHHHIIGMIVGRSNERWLEVKRLYSRVRGSKHIGQVSDGTSNLVSRHICSLVLSRCDPHSIHKHVIGAFLISGVPRSSFLPIPRDKGRTNHQQNKPMHSGEE